jgi:uncharacterized membrane protein
MPASSWHAVPVSDAPTFIDRFRDPLADPARERKRLRLAAVMTVAGLGHFVAPRFFQAIVPRWFPWRREAVLYSGIAELTAGALLAVPRTSRTGAAIATVTLVAVYPANVQMAIDAARGQPQVSAPKWVTWIRVPMQVPMIRTAWSLTR